MPLKVKKFWYNGFYGKILSGYAKYTAEFLRWTQDPGVAEFHCSDGKDRLIPTFALDKEAATSLPEQDYEKLGGKILFGRPSRS